MASRVLSLSRTSSLHHLRPLAGISPAGGFRKFAIRHSPASLNNNKTLADVVRSEEEATMKFFSVSRRCYYAFGAITSKELPSAPIFRNPIQNSLPPICLSTSKALRFFSSGDDPSDENSKSSPESSLVEPQATDSPSDENPKSSPESSLIKAQATDSSVKVEDVDNKELKKRIEQYFNGDEEALPSVLEAILSRKLSGKHEDTDDELMDEFRFAPVDGVKEEDFESDFESAHETDDEIKDLYNAKDTVIKGMMDDDEYFNMDPKKWDDIIREATQGGYLRDMRECEHILEDMLHFDKLLPDDIKQKVKEKFDELGDKCESKELEPEDAYKLFAEFEDQIVKDYLEKIQEEGSLQSEGLAEPPVTKRSDDPPGVGPILRWQTRAVFAPGGDAWHPKNRKVKLSVTVKELGLSQYQFHRLREIVGKRYNAGRGELTITSERFEHREENRKDCLRTLLDIIEEAGKADSMIEEARTSYVKQRLKANPAFMERLFAKTKQQTPLIA